MKDVNKMTKAELIEEITSYRRKLNPGESENREALAFRVLRLLESMQKTLDTARGYRQTNAEYDAIVAAFREYLPKE